MNNMYIEDNKQSSVMQPMMRENDEDYHWNSINDNSKEANTSLQHVESRVSSGNIVRR